LFGFSVQVRTEQFQERATVLLTRGGTETKNKTLEELDLFFGGSMESVAQADRERMHRINERLGITGAEHPGDRAGCTASVGQEKESAATAESAEHELKA
jgi:hypothetical protein